MKSNYYILVQDGKIFEGTSSDFKDKYYPSEDVTEDRVLDFAREWAEGNNWEIKIGMCH